MNSTTKKGFSLSKLRGANNEGFLVLVLLALIIGMSLMSDSFFTVATLFAILRASIVPMMLALSVLIILISGGIDVSFVAIALFASYTTAKLANDGVIDAGLIVVFVVAIVMGALLGAVNGVIIAGFRLQTLIVSLGTQTIFKGALIVFIGSKYIGDLPKSVDSISTNNLISIQTDVGMANLNILVIPVAIICLLVAFILKRTMFGRAIYAIGGDVEGARRAGFPVFRTQVMLYILSGVLAAVGGIFYIALNRSASVQTLVGDELDIIAAVVLGGAAIAGGRGSVFGTVLGVLLIQLINNTLVLIGIPGMWRRAAVGVLLIIGISIQAMTARQRKRISSLADLDVIEVKK